MAAQNGVIAFALVNSKNIYNALKKLEINSFSVGNNHNDAYYTVLKLSDKIVYINGSKIITILKIPYDKEEMFFTHIYTSKRRYIDTQMSKLYIS